MVTMSASLNFAFKLKNRNKGFKEERVWGHQDREYPFDFAEANAWLNV